MGNYQSGGRTRSIVNIANPGGAGGAAYSFTAASAVPSTSADGYANWGTQKMLHVSIGYAGGSGSNIVFAIWGYHSFSGEWAMISVIDPADGGNNAVAITVPNNSKLHCIVPIEGMERIAVQCTGWGTGGAASVFLGVNTI